MNMTELSVGKFKLTELAEWFGVTKSTFANTKQKKLEELKEFADYELTSSHQILIKKVRYPIYVKKHSKNYEIIKKQIPKTWNPDGIDTCKRVSHQIYTDKSNELTLSQSTTYVYTTKAKNDLYGKCGSKYGGNIGYSRYIWGIWDEDQQKYVKLNAEQTKIKNELLQKYMHSANEAALFIQDSIESGELTQEEAWEVYNEMTDVKTNYLNFLDEFAILTGFKLTKCTLITGKDWEEMVEA